MKSAISNLPFRFDKTGAVAPLYERIFEKCARRARLHCLFQSLTDESLRAYAVVMLILLAGINLHAGDLSLSTDVMESLTGESTGFREGFEGVPSLEDGPGGAGDGADVPSLFTGKVYCGSGKARVGISNEAHTGKKSAFLRNTEFDGRGEIYNGIVCADSNGITGENACKARPDTYYHFSFYLKGDTRCVEVYCAGWGKTTSSLYRQYLWTSLSERITPSEEWTKYEGVFKTLPTTTRFALILSARGSRERGMKLGTSFFLDDVCIREYDGPLPFRPPARKREHGSPGTLACYPVGEWFKVHKDGSAHDGHTWHKSSGAVESLPWDGWDGKCIRVKGARNEYVDFQLILKAVGNVILQGMEVSDLKGPADAVIGSDQVELFQQWYVDCPRASFPETEIETFDRVNDGNCGGVVPAQLPPLSHMLEQHYSDGGLDIRNPTTYVPADLPCQGIWVSVYVPPIDTPAGVYAGTITIRSDATNGVVRIPLELTVEDRCVPLIPYYRAYYPGGNLSHMEDGIPASRETCASPRYAELHLRSRMICSGYGVSYYVNPTWEVEKDGKVHVTGFGEDWREKYVEFGPIVVLDDLFMGNTNGVTGYDAGYQDESAQVYKQLISWCKEKGWWGDDVQRGQYEYSPDGPSYLNIPPGRKPVTVTVQPDEPFTDAQHEVLKRKCEFFKERVDPDLLVSSTGHLAPRIADCGIGIAMPHYGYQAAKTGLLYSEYFRSKYFKESGTGFKADYIWPYDNVAWVVDCAPTRMKKVVLGYPEMSGSFAGNYAWVCTLAQRFAHTRNKPTWRANVRTGYHEPGAELQFNNQHNCTLLYSGLYIGYRGPVRSMNLQYLRNATELYDLKMPGRPKFSDKTDPVSDLTCAIKDGRVYLTWKCDPKQNDDIKGFNVWACRGDEWGAGGRTFSGAYNPVYDCEKLNRPNLIRTEKSGNYEHEGYPSGSPKQHYILEMIDTNNNCRYYGVVR